MQRKFTCIYAERDDPSSSDGRPSKKRTVDEDDQESPSVNEQSTSNTPTNGHTTNSPLSHHARGSPLAHYRSGYAAQERSSNPLSVKHEENSLHPPDERPTVEAAAKSLQQFATGQAVDEPPRLMSRGTTVQSGQDEEAVVYTQSRMLQDPTGRLRRFNLYLLSIFRLLYMLFPYPRPSGTRRNLGYACSCKSYIA